ncbi:hypothetical protein CEXT_749271 [Caerostris extrusa]|uniref:Uncharacterized protein n=1 Tax=Caerostris extrusa TaxID=172846 RepID=A0AAV4V4H8_CAEEX|nr:hypothetical protein CEXT_749271 [Caerostris extrusa]
MPTYVFLEKISSRLPCLYCQDLQLITSLLAAYANSPTFASVLPSFPKKFDKRLFPRIKILSTVAPKRLVYWRPVWNVMEIAGVFEN